MEHHDFGNYLRALRAAQDFTQERLAEAVGCAAETIRSFESGRRRPSLSIAQRLAEVLAIPADEHAAFIRLARTPPASAPLNPAADALPTTLHAALKPEIYLPANALIGRQAESEHLHRLLLAERRRLITILGPGGIGKTRLALHLTTTLADAFADQSAFAALAAVTSAEHALTTIAAAVGCSLPGGLEPIEALLTFLRPRTLLLVIDNLEHLIIPPYGEQISTLLTRIVHEAPGVQIVLTSRERLRLRAEYVLELAPLSLPNSDTNAAIEHSDAVLLFLERARQISGAFTLTPANRRAVAQICRLIDGIPLALELAASWTRTLTCDEIAAEIHTSLDFLAQHDRDLPERHQSLRAVIDHSWRLLTPGEQSMLMRLALFQGGCRREAVRAVAADTDPTTTLTLLAALVDKSLVRRTVDPDGATRYDLHTLVRQYAAARHAADPTDQAATAARHAAYYAAWVAEQDAALKSAAQKQALQAISGEIDNIRAAWNWACRSADEALIGQMALTLDWFYELRGWHAEGVAAFSQGAAALEATSGETIAVERLRVYWLLVGRAGWHRLRHDPPGASQQQQQAVDHLRTLGDPDALLRCLTGLAYLQMFAGDYVTSEGLLHESVALALANADRWGHSVALVVRGTLEVLRNDARTAQGHMQAAVVAARACGDPRHITHALSYLSITALSLGQINDAESYCREGLTLAAEHQDRFQMGLMLQLLGQVALARGDLAECAWLLDEGLALARAIDDRWLEAQALGLQGALAQQQGDEPRARKYLCEAVTAATAAPAPIALDLLYQLATYTQSTAATTAFTLLSYIDRHPLTRPATRQAVGALRQAAAPRLAAEQRATAEQTAGLIPLELPAAAIQYVRLE